MQLPWTQGDWLARVTEWVEDQLNLLGIWIQGPIEVRHMRAWSAFASVPTSQGTVYFKAPAPNHRYEAALTQLLARERPDCIPQVLAVESDSGWFLTADAGSIVREQINSVGDLLHWHSILPLYAEMQIELAYMLPEFLWTGAPDRRLAQLPGLFDSLLEDTESLRVGRSKGLTVDEYDRLGNLRPYVADLCRALGDLALPEGICHEEVHDANVVVRDGRYSFTDWSDSSVSHPFHTMLVTIRSAAHRLGLDEYGPEMMDLRDRYLESWTDFQPMESLQSAFPIAYKLAMITRSLSYQQTLGHLPERYRIENDSIPGWLQDFLEVVP